MRALMSAAAFSLIAMTAPVAAQSTGLYWHGIIGAEFLRDSGGGAGNSFGLINMTFGMNPVSYGSWPGVGFEAGIFAFDGDGMSSEITGFAAITFALGGGRLHIGAPRNAVDGFSRSRLPGGSLIADVELGLSFGLLPYSTLIALSNDRLGLGLRYDRTQGATSFAISALRMDNGGTHLTDLGLAASHTFGPSRVYGTIEHLFDSTSSLTIASLGGETTFGGGTSSLGAIDVGGSLTVFVDSGTETLVSLYATAHPCDRLGVTLAAIANSSGGNTYGGLSAEYDLWHGVAVQAGVLGSSGSSSTLWSLGLRRRF